MGNSAGVVPSVVAGSLSGLLVVFRDVSFSLVYFKSAPLSGSITVVMALLLASSTISQAVYTRSHSLPSCIACPSSTAVPFQGAIAAAIAGSVSPEAAVSTVIVAFAIAAVSYGVLLAILSFTPHLDAFKSAVPQPVILGFFAVCGMGMLGSALELVHGQALSWRRLHELEPVALAQLGLALLAGVGNRAGTKVLRHFSVLPLGLLLQLTLFYSCLSTGWDIADARKSGWLWLPMPTLDLGVLDLSRVDWKSIAGQIPPIVSLLLMLVLDLLTTLLPIELMTTQKSISMAREFRIAGCASIASGACLGSVSYVSLSPTRLNVDAGGAARLSGATAALVSFLWIFAGMPLTAYIPKFVVGGLLIHLAFGYLLDGLWESRVLLPVGEYAVILFILFYYLATDLAPAIFMGLALCCFSFVLKYSQSAPLEFVTTAAEVAMASNRPRSPADRRYLRQVNGIVVARTFCSQLFFGSMASVMAEVQPRLRDPACRFLIFDFASIRSMDSSSLAGFMKLPPNIEVVLVGLGPALEAQVRRAALHVGLFATLDEALEWCEDRLLKFRHLQHSDFQSLLLAPVSNNPSITLPDLPVVEQSDVAAALRRAFQEDGLDALCDLFRPIFAKPYEVVFEEGAFAEGLFVVASGTMQIYYGHHRGLVLGPSESALDGLCKRRVGLARQDSGAGPPVRGRPVEAGDVLCEAALYVPHRHTYSLVADSLSLLLLLTRDKMLAAEQQHPRTAIRLHRRLMMIQHAETWLHQQSGGSEHVRFATI